jgi:hypothetical protein
VSDTEQIFVVGNSRSGTTMMGRILGSNPSVFTFRELHFFGTIWTKNGNQELTKNDQIDLLSKLFCIQENGLFNQNNFSEFNAKSEQLLSEGVKNPLEIYRLFLETITKEHCAEISCEQTPQNLYYLEEILQFFPNAKVINLVRDQRDVLLSQKNKWKRRFLGAKEIPLSEALRSYVNYHPILTSKIWNSSLFCTSKYFNHSQVKIVKFEDLLSDSEHVVKDICKFLKIDFQEQMLNVPVIGSSTENDAKSNLIIDSSKINKWKKGGLLNGEIYLSQKLSSKMMDKFNYEKKVFSMPPLSVIFYLILFPLKLMFAFILNIHRMGNIIEVIKKRFFVK